MLEFEKIKNTPISLINENNYKKPEINHLAVNAETINLEKINYNEKQYNNENQNLNNFQENNQVFSLASINSFLFFLLITFIVFLL